jgi:4-amino-4-deoxy-L-arabinose transferase-like glycosyltransferase
LPVAILSPCVKSATPISRAKVGVRNYALLFFACVLFHIAGTWSLPLIDRDEPRFAEASREMIERGNYVVPYFNNQLRLDKPPLTYWAQVASYRIFGENDFAARFPSAIAAALTAMAIFTWGRRIDAVGAGWWAAIIFTLSLQTFIHAKAAVADMWLVLFVTLAYWAAYEHLSGTKAGHRTFPWWWIFYLSLSFGFLAKGPIAWTPLVTAAAVIIYTRDWQLLWRFKFVRGILLTLVVVALWGIPALIQTHGEFFTVGIGRHVVTRSFTTMEGHGAGSLGMYLLLLPFYFVTVFISFLPWSIKLPWLLRKLWQNRSAGVDTPGYGGNLFDSYLVAGIAVIFIIFTLVKTKLPHYTLPAFPLLALLLARHWQGAAVLRAPQPAAASRRRSLFASIAVTTACIWIGIALVVPPMVARFFPAYQLFQQSRASLQPNTQFASVDFAEPSLVWYFRSRVNGFLAPLNKRRATEFMNLPGPHFVVLPTTTATSIFSTPPAEWRFFTTSGFNIAKGKRVDLTLVLKPQ